MKKGMIILGECIVFLIVINIFRIGLVNIFQDLENNRIFSYILYFVSALGASVIYRLNNSKSRLVTDEYRYIY